MIKDLDLVLRAEESGLLKKIVAKKLNINVNDITAIRYLRKSLDARRLDIKYNLKVRVFINEEEKLIYSKIEFKEANKNNVVVVGAGPAGLFAALTLIEHGYRPIVIERGKEVRERKLDLAEINRNGKLNSESNYSFGLGGAGTFSDGKLFTRSNKRGDISKVLALLCQHGADLDILADSKAHIGSDKLPIIVENIKDTIIKCGGEFHFNTKVVSLIKKNNEVLGVICEDGKEFLAPVILATGHSAHDTYEMLHKQGFILEAKDMAIGVRIEHKQSLIDNIQYHGNVSQYLPPASYSFKAQVDQRGVYSFCMCPGGFIIPASSYENSLVVNGMSPSSRGGKFANSGIVVQVKKEDLKEEGPLSMLNYIKNIEKKCYIDGYKAPSQRVLDFVNNKESKTLIETSYIPGLVSTKLENVLPALITTKLREGLLAFNKLARGKFLTNDALLIAPETRTSSPIRLVRNDDFSQIKGFYPAGEGSGYAGGIVSSAMDGIASATALINNEF